MKTRRPPPTPGLMPGAILGLALGLGLLSPAASEAGAIRPTAEMGPRARRILHGIRHERVRRDEAREARVRALRVAVARVRAPTLAPDAVTDLTRALEERLRARGFRVPPFSAVRGRIQRLGEAMLTSSVALRQLCRRLRVGKLLQLSVLEHRVATASGSGYALPTWWGREDLDREFVEVHLRLQVFDEAAGRVVLDRQDRQHRPVPPAPEGEPAVRGAVLEEAVGACLDHLLLDLRPGPAPERPVDQASS